jgi:polysaccharide pyruvyl transferase WcaK-like protein
MMKLLRKRLKCSFCFSVPKSSLQEEMQWAREYGVPIVPLLDRFDILPPWSLKRERLFVFSAFHRALSEADIVITSPGIAYVPGANVGSLLDSHAVHRLIVKARKRILAWTQSYGPFEGLLLKYFARRELNELPFLAARGEASQRNLESLNLEPVIYNFPDSAFALDRGNSMFAQHYLDALGLGTGTPLVGISPNVGVSPLSGYSELIRAVVEQVTQRGFEVVFIPHSIKSIASESDLALSRSLIAGLSERARMRTHIVQDDLDYMELKSLIGEMDFVIGSRYHALVSALSMGVPCVSLGWHEKYNDLLALFGLRDESWIYGQEPDEVLLSRICSSIENRDAARRQIEENLSTVLERVENSGKTFVEAIGAAKCETCG